MFSIRSYSRRWTREFIDIYKAEECLWVTKHPDYNNQIIRNKGYIKLLEKLREVESNADKLMVLRKINSLRSAFRRELRKMKKIPGYKSRLWYFNLISFTDTENGENMIESYDEQEQVVEDILLLPNTRCNIKEEDREASAEVIENNIIQALDEQEAVSIHESTIDHAIQQQQSTNQTVQITNTTDPSISKDPSKMMTAYTNYIPFVNSPPTVKQDDEYYGIGLNVACKLRTMKPTQRIIAEKLISDILFRGQLENLTISSQVTI